MTTDTGRVGVGRLRRGPAGVPIDEGDPRIGSEGLGGLWAGPIEELSN